MDQGRTYLFHGDECLRCPESRPGQPIRAALHHGYCFACWAGENESERRTAAIAQPDAEFAELQLLWATSILRPALDVMRLEDLLATPDNLL